MGTKNSKFVGSAGDLYLRNDSTTVWGTPATTGDLMNFGSSSTVGYDGNADHTLYPPSLISEDKCEIQNSKYSDKCQASRPVKISTGFRKYYEGCLCNTGVCPDGFTWQFSPVNACVANSTPSSSPATPSPSTPSDPSTSSAASDWKGDSSPWVATAIVKEDCQGYATQGVLVPVEGTADSTKLMWNEKGNVCQTVYSNVNGCGLVGLKYPANFNGAYLDCVPLDKAQLERSTYAAQVKASKGPTIPNTVATSPIPVPTSSGTPPVKPPAKPDDPADPDNKKPAKPTSKGLPKGAIIGLGVGGGLLLLIILFMIMNPPKK